ncbi:MAG: 3-dehydro-L-gulonate 2-dehydrogenase [Chitinophagaceae bacterium]
MKPNDTDNPAEVIRVKPDDMEATFYGILKKQGFTEEKARVCAQVFTTNSIDGVYTHGVNRFPRFIQYVRNKYILVNAVPTMVSALGGIEQWNGNLGPGPLNALQATGRVMELAKQHGMGCLGLADTNHWMRGGLYGWKAARAGFVFIGWTNTIANMPAWGASDSRLGNNPLVIAIPYNDEAIVLDMAMSQYSFGAIELHKIKSQQLAVPGGFDPQGNLTKDPEEILKTQKGLPVGYWKGAGLALVLDILAAILSAGNSTSQITQKGMEYAVSQVFIAIDVSLLSNYSSIASSINEIIDHYHGSATYAAGDKIIYPGERVINTRKENNEKGIPVSRTVWEDIEALDK